MKICIYGAGAVGGHIAGRLAGSEAQVSLIARGEQLAAIRRNGLRVETKDGTLISHPIATDRPGDLEPQDIVIVAVKAPTLPTIAKDVGSLLHKDSLVLFVMNGIPWWYFHSHGGPLDGTHLQRLDPEQALWDHIGPERAVGAVAYTACSVMAPGVIRAENPVNRLIIGRPDGRPDQRLDALASLLSPSGLQTAVTPNIRDAVWAKLLMNLIGGSLAVLTGSPMKEVLDKPAVAGTAKAMAAEGAAIAHSLGCDPGDPYEGLNKLAKSSHLQSIAQDLQAGRPMEIDAMFRVPLDLAELVQVPTPNLDLVIELATQRARAAGQYRHTNR
ncbi:2-dehydropantoate 2-reductase [Paenarthrobacter nicotinovorans]|uniref:ketopantoate reductase family protein n=1 Tax=Micrococcaceae TaxID=1268 RepID=UPI00087657F5|nr:MULTISPECIES: 2-dehydropantoate 2-reductase [Micrococcaceae]MDR6438675.1 2-dehydropantoate 2-reductase [Paenarthrobacter nicotinovorans]SCZ56579.1 2-dehydropantoate 2-reductase [Arthrobacter sp. UNCCL28]